MTTTLKEQIFYSIVGGLSDIENSLNERDFQDIFGKQFSHHFWREFTNHDHSLTVLYNFLDRENRSKLIQYLMKRIRLGIDGR